MIEALAAGAYGFDELYAEESLEMHKTIHDEARTFYLAKTLISEEDREEEKK